jgi:hypothetical protein
VCVKALSRLERLGESAWILEVFDLWPQQVVVMMQLPTGLPNHPALSSHFIPSQQSASRVKRHLHNGRQMNHQVQSSPVESVQFKSSRVKSSRRTSYPIREYVNGISFSVSFAQRHHVGHLSTVRSLNEESEIRGFMPRRMKIIPDPKLINLRLVHSAAIPSKSSSLS